MQGDVVLASCADVQAAALLLPNAGSDLLNEDDTLNQTSKMISIIRVPKNEKQNQTSKKDARGDLAES